MRKVVIITGLTASGKSGLAVNIAKEFNGEIISADSVQIYKGLNIGSAKVDNQTMQEIKHHLINIKEFSDTYNVGQFIDDTNIAINAIISQGKLPIIVGGTGMYIKALMEGYTLGGTTADSDVRNKYNQLANEKGNLAVWEELNKLNPARAKQVHYNNLKRVIRYLEIELNGEELTKSDSILKNYEVLCIGIIDNRETIYSRINQRVDEMMEDGLITEIENLLAQGANFSMQSFNSIGYKEWEDYFNQVKTKQETIDLIKQHTRNYCKRQLTFLKTINNIKLMSLTDADETIRRFLND